MTRTTRRRAAARAAAPAIGLLVAGLLVWQGSYAAFSATTSNTGNAWTTGSLTLTNNGGGTTYSASTTGIFAESGMAIGSTGTKCITVSSGGDIAGDLRLYRGALGTNGVAGETAAQAQALASQIQLTVAAANLGSASGNVDSSCAGFPSTSTTVLASTLAAMPTTYAAASGISVTPPPGTQRVAYQITWTLGSGSNDNALQGLSASADLVWEIDQV